MVRFELAPFNTIANTIVLFLILMVPASYTGLINHLLTQLINHLTILKNFLLIMKFLITNNTLAHTNSLKSLLYLTSSLLSVILYVTGLNFTYEYIIIGNCM